METPEVLGAAFRLLPPSDFSRGHPRPGLASRVAGWTRTTWGFCFSWAIGLPRRAGARLHAANDAEARWWHWEVTQCYGGLGRQYRDARFAALPLNPALRRDEIGTDPPGTNPAGTDPAGSDPAPPGCRRHGEL
jgi:hypothetical protein